MGMNPSKGYVHMWERLQHTHAHARTQAHTHTHTHRVLAKIEEEHGEGPNKAR